MNAGWRRKLQCAAACVPIAAYAGLSHYCNSVGAHDLGAALVLGPLSLLALIGAMFVAEYFVRRRALPETRCAGLLATIRGYFAPSEFS